MIKLMCPECNMDELYFLGIEGEKDQFICENCGKIFSFEDAEWEQQL